MGKPTNNAAQAERLLRECDKSTGCWLWKGASRHRLGYGAIWYNGRLEYCHRLSWILHNGPIPEGMHICHKCDTPACFNPEHLFIGTMADNMHDMRRKGRYRNKLSDEQVSEIRRFYGQKSQHQLAAEYGVSQAAIWYVLRRRDAWRTNIKAS